MLRLKMDGLKTSGSNWIRSKRTGARKQVSRIAAGFLVTGLLVAGAASMVAQDSSSSTQPATQQPTAPTSIYGTPIAPAAKVTYKNRWEIYGGLNFMNFQAGQNLPKRMNLGGGEILGTYWLPSENRFLKNLGVGAEYRGEAGTTPVFPAANVSPYYIVRPLVYMNMGLAGAQYRGPKNQYAAINFHAYFGVSHGTFDATQKKGQPSFGPTGFFTQTGLYTNRTKPVAALGGSVDFNWTKNVAIRFSPDLMLEHFGTETREFFAISSGVVYRFGKK